MTDTQTLDVYADRAKDYADRFAADGASETEEFIAFTNALPPSGRVLDWGCGPGHWSAQFQRAGFDADATDASPEMAAVARERFGINVRVEPFDALDSRGQYHGIWAHFSLLHAPRADFASHLGRAMRALKPGGHLLLGLKLGDGFSPPVANPALILLPGHELQRIGHRGRRQSPR